MGYKIPAEIAEITKNQVVVLTKSYPTTAGLSLLHF